MSANPQGHDLLLQRMHRRGARDKARPTHRGVSHERAPREAGPARAAPTHNSDLDRPQENTAKDLPWLKHDAEQMENKNLT